MVGGDIHLNANFVCEVNQYLSVAAVRISAYGISASSFLTPTISVLSGHPLEGNFPLMCLPPSKCAKPIYVLVAFSCFHNFAPTDVCWRDANLQQRVLREASCADLTPLQSFSLSRTPLEELMSLPQTTQPVGNGDTPSLPSPLRHFGSVRSSDEKAIARKYFTHRLKYQPTD